MASRDEDPLLLPAKSTRSPKTHKTLKGFLYASCLLAAGFVFGLIAKGNNDTTITSKSVPFAEESPSAKNDSDEPPYEFIERDADVPLITIEKPMFDLDEVLHWEQDHPNHDINAERISQVEAEEEEVLTMLHETEHEEYEEDDDKEYPVLSYDLRSLMEEDHMENHGMHMPLACNANLTSQTCASLSTLSVTPGEIAVIPCGRCFEVDIQDGSTWELPDGLRVEGKIFIPSSANFILHTTFVFVLGLLKIDPPMSGNQVKISLYGEEEVTYTASMAEMECHMGCNMSSKVIAVLGGQLDIRGYDASCKTWEKLEDIGPSVPRPFVMPDEGLSYEITGTCSESAGHTSDWGKYTVACPIAPTATVNFGEFNLGLKFTTMEPLPPPNFTAPTDGWSLQVKGPCTNSQGHTDANNKCVVQCPLEDTVPISSGETSQLMTFTSTEPTPPVSFVAPIDGNGDSMQLQMNGGCGRAGHSDWKGKCVIQCPVKQIGHIGSGAEHQLMNFTSVVPPPPGPFVPPTDGEGNSLELTVTGGCGRAGHTDRLGKCVVHCPLQQTFHVGSGTTSPLTFTNVLGEHIDLNGVHHWAWNGNIMFFYPDGYTVDTCAQAAIDISEKFPAGYGISVSNRLVMPVPAGQTFDITGVMHWAWNGNRIYFYPDGDYDSSVQSCGQAASDFSDMFPVDYRVDISNRVATPVAPGETLDIDAVMHWSWNGRDMFFYPAQSDPATCNDVAAEMTSKFPIGYGIDVTNRRDISIPWGQEIAASKGVLHYAWGGSNLFFWPDEDVSLINSKLLKGYRLDVSYLDAVDYHKVKVSPEAAACWKPGSELLLTSHTRWDADRTVAIITESDPVSGMLTLDRPLERPISVADDPTFAVEVALLNRPVVFEAESDADDELIGGHLVVHHTSAAQHIEGIEVKNFGQQGRLGRYPIHFHMSGDHPNSIVKRNVVRDSNQRCYVVHMTNQLTLEDNVAHNAFGHCYFLEAGTEVGNTFRRNLGAGIKILPAERVALLEAASMRDETDDKPSVFWISHAENAFYDNVAGGSERHGYWFETHGHVRSNSNLLAFENNEVHSSGHFAFQTYSPGWMPSEVNVIKNLKVYRNPSWGAFLHVTRNLVFEGGIFADNGQRDVMINRGDDIVFNGTIFIGQSEFSDPLSCPGGFKVAIHLHPARIGEFDFRGTVTGTSLINTEFQKWSTQDTQCAGSQPLKFNADQVFVPQFSAPHYFEDVGIDSFSETILGGCDPADLLGLDDMILEIGSDSNQAFSAGGNPGFLVSPKVTGMLPQGTCSPYNDCLEFCEGACLRTITVLTGDAAMPEDVVMVVTDIDSDNEITIERGLRSGEQTRFSAYFGVALPSGSFTAKFIKNSTQELVWPGYATPVFEAAPKCTNHIMPSDLVFEMPGASRAKCNELIYNGNFDSGIEGWQDQSAGIAWLPTGGVDGSGALNTTIRSNMNQHFAYQWLDVSCIEEGEIFDIEVSYRNIDKDGAVEEACSGNSMDCPIARIARSKFVFGVFVTGWRNLADTSNYNGTEGVFNTISGSWTVSMEEATSDRIHFNLPGGTDQLVIDNVSIRKRTTRTRALRANIDFAAYPGPIEHSNCPSDGAFVHEDFTDPNQLTSAYSIEGSLGSHYEFTRNSLLIFNRTSFRHAPVFDLIDIRHCLQPDVTYLVTAKVKLTRQDAAPDTVEPSDCLKSNTGCLDLKYEWIRQDGGRQQSWVYQEEPVYGFDYGEIINIAEEIVFNEDQLADTNTYQRIRFEGPLETVNIEIIEFNFYLPPAKAFKTESNACDNLAPEHGDAELDLLSPFPYKTNAYYVNLLVREDESDPTNHYFEVTGRSAYEGWSGAGIQWKFPAGCMGRGHSQYLIHFDARIHPNEAHPDPTHLQLNMIIRRSDGSSSNYEIVKCPSSDGDWVSCDGVYAVPGDIIKEGDTGFEYYFDTPHAPTVNYDIDNLRIESVGGPTDTLIQLDS